MDYKESSDKEIERLKAIAKSHQDYEGDLETQRNSAYLTAEKDDGPGISWLIPAGLGVLAGTLSTVFIVKRTK